jgi:nicotinamidase-related amidase
MPKRAVIVIDMLNDFVTGALANPAGQEITPRLATLLDHARRAGWLVVYANDAHLPGDPEERVWGPHALAGTPGADVIPELAPQPGDVVLPKRFYSSFYETGLASLLRQNGVEEVVLVGQHTNICVRHTSSDAFNNFFAISVPRDGVAMFRLPDHTNEDYDRIQQDALDYLVTCYGANITTIEELTGAPVRAATNA